MTKKKTAKKTTKKKTTKKKSSGSQSKDFKITGCNIHMEAGMEVTNAICAIADACEVNAKALLAAAKMLKKDRRQIIGMNIKG